MTIYIVTYEAIVEAETPEDAAGQAFDSMLDATTFPPLLSVRAPDGTVTDVDMAGEEITDTTAYPPARQYDPGHDHDPACQDIGCPRGTGPQ